MKKNAFHFILKAIFILKIFKFLSWLFGHVEKNDCIGNVRFISKFLSSRTEKQTITIHILPKMLWSEGKPYNDQLIEHSKSKIKSIHYEYNLSFHQPTPFIMIPSIFPCGETSFPGNTSSLQLSTGE